MKFEIIRNDEPIEVTTEWTAFPVSKGSREIESIEFKQAFNSNGAEVQLTGPEIRQAEKAAWRAMERRTSEP